MSYSTTLISRIIILSALALLCVAAAFPRKLSLRDPGSFGTNAPPAGGGSTLTNGLVAYWKLDEASGTRNDSFGSNHLGDTNTVTSTNAIIANGSFHIRANSERLSLADNTDLSLGTDTAFTWSCWVSMSVTNNTCAIIGKGTSIAANGTEYCVQWNNGPLRFRFAVGNNAANQNVSTNIPVTLGTWYFLVCWHDPDANVLGISLNNGAALTASWSSGTYDGDNVFNVGAIQAANHLDGAVDEVGFWKRVLTADERTELYNGGTGKTYPF